MSANTLTLELIALFVILCTGGYFTYKLIEKNGFGNSVESLVFGVFAVSGALVAVVLYAVVVGLVISTVWVAYMIFSD